MAIGKTLDNILNTNSKIKIIRLFIFRRQDFVASGRQIARLVDLTPPAVHTALKDLYNQDILKREIIGKQHLYSLNAKNRTVNNILRPAFKSERSIKKDIFDFLKKIIQKNKVKDKIVSLILYGSLQTSKAGPKSDVDIAVITKAKTDKRKMEEIFTGDAADKFYEYFGIHLDVYTKSKAEFIGRLKKNLPPVSTLMHSYFVIYGKDPLDIK